MTMHVTVDIAKTEIEFMLSYCRSMTEKYIQNMRKLCLHVKTRHFIYSKINSWDLTMFFFVVVFTVCSLCRHIYFNI